MKKNDGSDTVITAITALLAMFPSTMYVDGEGAMAGDGGYVLFFQTAFTIDEATKAWYCLSDWCLRLQWPQALFPSRKLQQPQPHPGQ